MVAPGTRFRATSARSRTPAARVAVVASLAAFALALASAPATIAAPSLVLSPTSGNRGAAVQATANSFPKGSVSLWWDNGAKLGQSDAGGRVRRIPFTVPAGSSGGQHRVRACSGATCTAGGTSVFATFTVTGVPAPTPQPTPRQTPRATPAPTPRETPRVTAAPVATPVPGSSPAATSGSAPASPGEGGASAAPSQAAAGGGIVVPTTEPAANPSEPGTVKVQFPWLDVVPNVVVLILVVIAAIAASRWLRSAGRHPQGAVLMQKLTAGTHDPPKAPAPPADGVRTIRLEVTELAPSGEPLSAPGEALPDVQEVAVTKPADASLPSGEMRLKGSKIKES
jgi:hypothetical protein